MFPEETRQTKTRQAGSGSRRRTGSRRRRHRHTQKWLMPLILLLLCAAGTALWYFGPLKNTGQGIGTVWRDEQVADPEASLSVVDSSPESIPDYSGEDVIELCGGIPNFNQYDLDKFTGEHYGTPDRLGRCRSAMAMLDKSMMPAGEREPIGSVKPTGFVQEKYPGIIDTDPPYLYNRSHLIAFAMTGQNANEKNLITGTRHMNAETMLAYEEKVLRYLDRTGQHVLYRVSPYFKGVELVARGVEMEAYSVEDLGRRGVLSCFRI